MFWSNRRVKVKESIGHVPIMLCALLVFFTIQTAGYDRKRSGVPGWEVKLENITGRRFILRWKISLVFNPPAALFEIIMIHLQFAYLLDLNDINCGF